MNLARLALASGLLTAAAFAQGTILGSAHDFRAATWNTGTGARPGEVCAVCHMPHVEGRPASRTNTFMLWSRQLTSANYTMYSSFSLQGTQDSQPQGSSRLCLGCHDGSVALEMFHTNTAGNTFIDAAHRIPGKPNYDFGADHPISITYADGAGGDPYLRSRTSPFPGVVNGQTINDILEGGKVQCMSCHDPHGVQVPAGTANLLRIRNNDPANPSALCLACHIK